MFDRLVELLSPNDDIGTQDIDIPDCRLASAALLVEAATIDGVFEQAERDRILDLLCWRFEVDEQEGEALLADAVALTHDSHSMYRYSQAIRSHLSEQERVTIVELLWDIAYIDGDLHPREASLMRKITGLLYVPDKQSGQARKRVLARLGIGAD